MKSIEIIQKKLKDELLSLAHATLSLKNKNDVFELNKKAAQLHEKLAVLAALHRTVSESVLKDEVKEEVEMRVSELLENNSSNDVETSSTQLSKPVQESSLERLEIQDCPKEELNPVAEKPNKEEQPISQVAKDDREIPTNKEIDLLQKEAQEPSNNQKAAQKSFEEELQNTLSIEETQRVFNEVASATNTKKSLNDVLVKSLNIGLNDRIAFVKNLFDNSQADFNRVVSQLNTFDTENEALNFLNLQVKPDYDWSGKELYEERLIQIISRKFA